MRSVLLIFLDFCVVLLCVLVFLVPCCDVRYDFRIKTMFGSSLPPVGGLICVICVYLHIVEYSRCLVVFLFCLSSSCVLCTLFTTIASLYFSL